jgi:hypothetical protein
MREDIPVQHKRGYNFLVTSRVCKTCDNLQKSSADARKQCCDVGMTLISLESLAKIECFTKLTQRKAPWTHLIPDSKVLTEYRNPALIGEFWTSGSDQGCPGNYSWCSTGFEFRNQDVKWRDGAPDTRGGCVFLKNANTTAESHLAADSCTAQKRFVCEVRKLFDERPC